jgi:hypothetical protein
MSIQIVLYALSVVLKSYKELLEALIILKD